MIQPESKPYRDRDCEYIEDEFETCLDALKHKRLTNTDYMCHACYDEHLRRKAENAKNAATRLSNKQAAQAALETRAKTPEREVS